MVSVSEVAFACATRRQWAIRSECLAGMPGNRYCREQPHAEVALWLVNPGKVFEVAGHGPERGPCLTVPKASSEQMHALLCPNSGKGKWKKWMERADVSLILSP